MVLSFFWTSLREHRDEKGLEELDALYDGIVNPLGHRRERALANLAAMGKITGGGGDG